MRNAVADKLAKLAARLACPDRDEGKRLRSAYWACRHVVLHFGRATSAYAEFDVADGKVARALRAARQSDSGATGLVARTWQHQWFELGGLHRCRLCFGYQGRVGPSCSGTPPGLAELRHNSHGHSIWAAFEVASGVAHLVCHECGAITSSKPQKLLQKCRGKPSKSTWRNRVVAAI